MALPEVLNVNVTVEPQTGYVSKAVDGTSSTEENLPARDRMTGHFLPGNQSAKGVKGGGNPDAKRLAELKKVFRECVTEGDVKDVVKSLVQAAKDGDVQAIKLFLDRTLGKQPIAIESDDGEPLQITIRHTVHKAIEDAERND
jgi:hypothetical protein